MKIKSVSSTNDLSSTKERVDRAFEFLENVHRKTTDEAVKAVSTFFYLEEINKLCASQLEIVRENEREEAEKAQRVAEAKQKAEAKKAERRSKRHKDDENIGNWHTRLDDFALFVGDRDDTSRLDSLINVAPQSGVYAADCEEEQKEVVTKPHSEALSEIIASLETIITSGVTLIKSGQYAEFNQTVVESELKDILVNALRSLENDDKNAGSYLGVACDFVQGVGVQIGV